MSIEPAKSPIRVLIVDDSAFMRAALTRIVASDPGLSVAATAASGTEALQRIAAIDPDVITLDVQMPGIDGLETLRRIMVQSPCPVIMVSSATLKDAEITFSALAAGAFDYVPKQLSPASLDILDIRDDLVAKIKAAAESRRAKDRFIGPRKPPQAVESPMRQTSLTTPAIVALGISTGGPSALEQILPSLPVDLPVPILVVQHMPVGFTAFFAKRLDDLCAVSVCEASHGEMVLPGVVYIAPAGLQMTVERLANSQTLISLSDKPEKQLHVPSVDVMMESVASVFHSQAMGVIMTGMGADGAQGMSAIHRERGFTLGQDQLSCAVYGMPRVCAEMGILDRVVPLSQIPREVLHATHYRKAGVG
jgi:two-component system, chemotaxis family, protein-glutamate methylesterase/glutaminase